MVKCTLNVRGQNNESHNSSRFEMPNKLCIINSSHDKSHNHMYFTATYVLYVSDYEWDVLVVSDLYFNILADNFSS